ncbi:Ankyrin repeats (3 copies) [compost metagenome]
MHYAVQNFLIKITEMLLEKSNVNAIDNYGNTVIWRAVFASEGRGEIIKLLLSKGADPNIKNNSNVSAMDLANTIANYNVKQYLIS